ncbi:MAG: U32 family peptidase [Lachnospiraceae bacterium]|nr:U32 family peptidase [Lachnospiraceae bacterium]
MENAEDKRSDKYGQPAISAALSIDGRMIGRPELLAPAGEPEAVYGALSAGADAVYLGAEKFSARAYARNFSAQELIKVIDHAHLFNKKIYLACNILMRRSEIEEIYPMLDPLYEHGIDGVIVQDSGLLLCLNRRYPQLPLHASTQMSVNSVSGAAWLKEHGVCRVVPGRELSLAEIRQIREYGIEVECFVHGAMCYSYSGKCLLSSLAGGRSGNRGRCAGPCRQPYSLKGHERAYYLSMKDMMALTALPGLIDAGVDSFKIEGRMKAPEYSAGVSAIYRKYIDMYLSGADFKIDKSDIKDLEVLYMRSERQEGYLERHNGREMISLDSPAYSKVSEELKERIREEYINKPLKKKISAVFYIKAGEEVCLKLSTGGTEFLHKGDIAQKADKRPLSDDDIKKQLCKTGDTDFTIDKLVIDNDGSSFMPVSALNAIRREAFAELLEALRFKRSLDPANKEDYGQAAVCPAKPLIKAGLPGNAPIKELAEIDGIDAFILEADLFLKNAGEYIKQAGGKKLYIRLPAVIRQKDAANIASVIKECAAYPVSGFYTDGYDGIKLIKENAPNSLIFGDQGLYVFNPYAEKLMLKELAAYTISHEFSASDINGAIRKDAAELIVYGRAPVMYSANCILKTAGGCDRTKEWTIISDEKSHSFPVRMVHDHCYNIMYNCVPLSLHREMEYIYENSGLMSLRLEFTDESPKQIVEISKAFAAMAKGALVTFPPAEFKSSRGHYKRGVE